MPKQTVAEQFIDILVASGVRRLYGVVGDSLNPVVDAVRRNAAIDWIHVRRTKSPTQRCSPHCPVTAC